MSGFDLPENGGNIRDLIYIDAGLAAAGGPYAYFLRERSKKLVVKVPAGVREGQRIRLAGMGHEGRGGGAPGDLLLEVRLNRPILERIKSWVARILDRDTTHLHKQSRHYWYDLASRHLKVVEWQGFMRKLLFGKCYLHISMRRFRAIAPAMAMILQCSQ